ncbi:hypothetical protein MLD38_038879 [Melastoma candidum]|uniref:Uncharacterized protein n=1 Tax=Melastoma candidum TaxID=119954 RepID=A0ACB9L2M0_9MYRT|nr:hypothetical protein MLD38_038879 [Melastoma candidum]
MATASAVATEGRFEDEEQCEGSIPARSDDVLEFLDSLDAYLVRMESLSSQLRQGWFELASARHSMGPYRINRVLLDHKDHSAATYLLLNDDGYNERSNLQFRLCKWGSPSNTEETMEGKHDNSNITDHASDSLLRRRGAIQSPVEESKDNTPTKTSTLEEPSSPIQSERLKSLSVFGTLISPKLRTAQLSFESALESLVEMANLRSSVLSTYEKLAKELHEAKAR